MKIFPSVTKTQREILNAFCELEEDAWQKKDTIIDWSWRAKPGVPCINADQSAIEEALKSLEELGYLSSKTSHAGVDLYALETPWFRFTLLEQMVIVTLNQLEDSSILVSEITQEIKNRVAPAYGVDLYEMNREVMPFSSIGQPSIEQLEAMVLQCMRSLQVRGLISSQRAVKDSSLRYRWTIETEALASAKGNLKQRALEASKRKETQKVNA